MPYTSREKGLGHIAFLTFQSFEEWFSWSETEIWPFLTLVGRVFWGYPRSVPQWFTGGAFGTSHLLT
jgi:hypothetical protein